MFDALFTPVKIGPVKVRNRVYQTPHTLAISEPAPNDPAVLLPSERHIHYYAERAKGGVGLIIMESSSVHPSSDYLFSPSIHDARSVPRMRRIAQAVHRHGAKLFVQLIHAGHHAYNYRTFEAALSASQVPDVLQFTVPKVMEAEDIDEVQKAFTQSAVNAVRAGFDGVELHGTHSFLIEQFLSPFFNKRTDEYGGSTENRMRFLTETLTRIRQRIRSKAALGVRLNVEEFLNGGLTNEDMADIAQRLEAKRLVDFLDLDIGTFHTIPLVTTPMNMTALHAADYISEIKKTLKQTTVLGCPGRLSNPADAERLIREGMMDLVGGARLHIIDPEWTNKARQGRVDDIRHCIGCNWCLYRVIYQANAGIACTLNPTTGCEKAWGVGTLKKAKRKKRIAVVGGGPSGMEATRVLALRGHEVALYEKNSELGGRLRTESQIPGQELMLEGVAWLSKQLHSLGVNLQLGREATADELEKDGWDAVVLATGAAYTKTGISGFIPAPIEGWNQPRVVTPEAILDGGCAPLGNILILDDENGVIGIGLAELLADRGCSVEIITRWMYAGAGALNNLQFAVRFPALYKKGVKTTPNTYIKRIGSSDVTVFNVYTNDEQVIQNVNCVVMVTSKLSNAQLCGQLKGKIRSLHAVGDCVAPRGLGEVTHEAHALARTL